MHNKYLIFDDQIVWTGSTNLTVNGSFRNNNNVLVVHSPEVATIFKREFDEMWAGEFGARAPSTIEAQSTTIQGTPIQIFFSAEDHPVSAIVPIIESAEESIRFMAFSFTHDDLGGAILDRAADGVEVQGIFETRGSQTEFSELGNLYCAGLAVRQDGNPGILHHKVIIVDGRVVITGSANFSNNADRNNDENVIVLANEEIAAEYLREFDRRWSEAREPDPADLDC
jgi:phosphatidylserine/phosphatidylglycerophosphate/cardiolipin synthase-like enzyme